MTSPGPSHSIHVAVVRLIEPLIGGPRIGPEGPVPDDPESIAFWSYQVNVAWALLAFACLMAMAAVAVSLQLLVSDAAGNVALGAGMGAAFFCLAGCANTIWRMYLMLPQARRLAAGGAHEAAQAALRRSLPPNTSVVGQAAVGILAAVMTAVNV